MAGWNRTSHRGGLSAICGAFGLAALLAHPAAANVTISKKPTQNISCSGGVCTPTAKTAVLNVRTLQQMLAASDVAINTGSGQLAKQVHSIVIAATVSWASAHTLTLSAYTSVEINKTVAITSSGGLSIAYNNGSTLGSFTVGPAGRVYFWDLNSSLTIQGTPYVLVNNIMSLASDVAANPSGHFALANGYNASSDGTYTHAAVPTSLTGTFDGLGNQIYNLAISDDDTGVIYVGLFAQIDSGAEVRNLGISQVNLGGTGQVLYEGALAGRNGGLVRNVYSTGSVSIVNPNSLTSGLVAWNDGTITDSWSNVTPSGGYSGGLVYQNTGTITRSHASGAVLGHHQAGGLVGTNTGIVQYSYATGSVSGTEKAHVGGLAGVNEGTVNQCFATGSAFGEQSVVGGLVGSTSSAGTISQSYATGSVTAADNAFVGGLVGVNNPNTPISQSYSTGLVTGGSNTFIGGLVGADFAGPGSIRITYWDMDTSGVDDRHQGAGNLQDDPGIRGLTSSQLRSGLPGGFKTRFWAQNAGINNGFPYLLNAPPPQ